MSSIQQNAIKHKIGLLNLSTELGMYLTPQGDEFFSRYFLSLSDGSGNRRMMLPMVRSGRLIPAISAAKIPSMSASARCMERIYQQTFVDTYSKWA